MVGDPKHLSDLSRIEAALWTRCRSCGHQRVFDREMLGSHLRNNGGVPVWSALAARLPCRCRSTDLVLKPMPYSGPVRDPELRGFERMLIELAISVLTDAGERVSSAKADTLAVRLALRVLLPHVMNRGTLTSLWQSGSTDNPMIRTNGYFANLDGVRHQLQMMGRL